MRKSLSHTPLLGAPPCGFSEISPVLDAYDAVQPEDAGDLFRLAHIDGGLRLESA